MPPMQIPGPMKWVCTPCEAEDKHPIEWWSSQEAAKAAAVWHVYDEHREQFIQVLGADRPPKDPRPELIGRQLAPWEYPDP